jgi:long-subunit fatty acid transport protein
VALAPRAARAGNDEGVAVRDEAALTANTVAATVSDGSSLFYNPAGLGGVDRDQIDVAATAMMLRFYALPSFLSTSDGAAADGSFTEFVSVPSAVSYVRAIGKDWRLGVGVFVPESSTWSVDVPLQTGGNTFHVSGSNRQSLYYGMIGAGYRVSPRLRVGASLSGLYFSGLPRPSAGRNGYNPAARSRRWRCRSSFRST